MPFSFLNDAIRSFFGLSSPGIQPSDLDNDDWNSQQDDQRPHINPNDYFEDKNDDFVMFRDAFEMNKVFERHFNDIIKVFSSDMFGEPFGRQGDFFQESHDTPQLPASKSIRDEYLKPGYHKEDRKKSDSDVDGEIAAKDLNDFFNKDNNNSIQTREPSRNHIIVPKGDFFGRVIITQSVTKPDGSVETRRTVRDSRTNDEETTITITQPDYRNDNFDRITPRYDDSDMWSRIFGRRSD